MNEKAERGAFSAHTVSRNSSLGARSDRGPAEKRHIYAGAVEFHAFGFEEAALERTMRFRDEQTSSSANNAVPGDALSTGASGHRVADRSRAAAQTQLPRKFTVRSDFAARDLLDQPIHRLPGHGLCVLRDRRIYRRDAENAERIGDGGSAKRAHTRICSL